MIRLSVSPLPDFASQTLLGHSAHAGLPAEYNSRTRQGSSYPSPANRRGPSCSGSVCNGPAPAAPWQHGRFSNIRASSSLNIKLLYLLKYFR